MIHVRNTRFDHEDGNIFVLGQPPSHAAACGTAYPSDQCYGL